MKWTLYHTCHNGMETCFLEEFLIIQVLFSVSWTFKASFFEMNIVSHMSQWYGIMFSWRISNNSSYCWTSSPDGQSGLDIDSSFLFWKKQITTNINLQTRMPNDMTSMSQAEDTSNYSNSSSGHSYRVSDPHLGFLWLDVLLEKVFVAKKKSRCFSYFYLYRS